MITDLLSAPKRSHSDIDEDEEEPVDEDMDYNEMKPSWNTLDLTEISQQGVLYPPENQYRNLYEPNEEDERIDNAMDILSTPEGKQDWTPEVGTIVYHGGHPLDAAALRELDRVFYVSMTREAAEKYGPVTEYRIAKKYKSTVVMWDQVAAGYGFDVTFDGYDTWEDFEDDFSGGAFGDAQKEAERSAHILLSKMCKKKKTPLVISSWEDDEYGFFCTALDALEPVEPKKL